MLSNFTKKCDLQIDKFQSFCKFVTELKSVEIFESRTAITQALKLLREDDAVVYGDSGCIGIEKRDEIKNYKHFSKINLRINRRPKSLPKVSDNAIDWERYMENRKFAVRCKVEHAFKIIKNTFNFRKFSYKGLAKNLYKLNVLFACENLLMVK